MKAAEERELEIIKKQQHLERVTTAMFKKVTAEERDIALEKERQSGLEETEEQNNDNENDDDDDEYVAVNPPVEVKTKARKTRRKQKEQKQLKQQLLKKKLEKKKITDIHR